MDNPQHTPAERAELALTNARAFCDLLAEARHCKAPGWWDGSSYRSHPCGLVADTIKFTNFWHVDNMCSIEITDGLGWGVANVSQDSFGHRSPHPAPIEGAALRVWWCGQWADAAYKEALRPPGAGDPDRGRCAHCCSERGRGSRTASPARREGGRETRCGSGGASQGHREHP